MWGGAITREQLRQTISRLRTLNEVPEMPKENILVSGIDSTRCLSISRENEIASSLAFLSATTDDSLKVMAVCIEEHSNGEGVTIRVASNTGDLSTVTSGFKILAKVLEQTARRENTKPENIEALFRQVVSLDLDRILSRLRSRHAKSRKAFRKPALITQLNQVVHDKSVNASSGFPRSSLKNMRDRARVLQALFTRLESESDLRAKRIEVLEVIGDIVKEAYRFSISADLSTAIRSFSGNPSLKNYLPEAIGKLGRYYSATSELVCAARDRRCRIFQRIQVEPVAIPRPASTQEALGRVHAEIQLLFFYELYPELPRPRIICSSKSACYLCNLFFHLHGSFHVPRTHGRLYNNWTLPDWLDVPAERRQDLSIIVTQLMATLDQSIKTALKSKKRQFLHPNESVLLPPAHWTSSALSGNLMPSPAASTSTIRRRSPLIQEENSVNELPLHTELLLTPPRTPLEPHYPANSDTETVTGRGAVVFADNSTPIIPIAETASEAVLDTVSLINVRRNELPYSQSIKLTTPSLHLRLSGLSLNLDFLHVHSGRLLIAHVEDATVAQKGYRVVNIEDIPTTTELSLNCSPCSDELNFRLQNAQRETVCITFLWDGI